MAQLLTKTLSTQIDDFIASLEKYNAHRPRPRRKKDYEYLRHFYKDLVKDRNKRALEIESKAYQKVITLAQKQFPAKTMFNLCIDGRVQAILAFGSPAVVGSSLRVPGGMLRDFIRGVDGQLKLLENTVFAKLLTHAYENYGIDVIAEVFDSHVGCAARLAEEQIKGRSPQDFGLMADVSHKRQIADATIEFVRQRFGETKKIIPIQTSFDPHTGYIYMGLGRAEVFHYARKKYGGYTKEALDDLVKKKKIISTEKLATDPMIEKLLAAHFFKLDWKGEYITSARKFWEGVAKLKKTLGPIISDVLLNVFPDLSKRDTYTKLEKEERILLIIANTFSGFLHSHKEGKEHSGDLSHIHESHYPYGVHEEVGVSVSEGGYPPYNMSLFSVLSFDEKNLSSNIELSASLVRKNRGEGRIADSYDLFSNTQEFVEASVPVAVKEVVRDTISDEQWRALEGVSWNDLPGQWDSMSDAAFMDYLHTKAHMTPGVMIGINNLRRRMAVLYDPTNPTSTHLVEHYKVALPLIVGRYRTVHFVVPFVKLGFS